MNPYPPEHDLQPPAVEIEKLPDSHPTPVFVGTAPQDWEGYLITVEEHPEVQVWVYGVRLETEDGYTSITWAQECVLDRSGRDEVNEPHPDFWTDELRDFIRGSYED